MCVNGQGWWSKPKSGDNFNNESCMVEFEAYNRYGCYSWGSGGFQQFSYFSLYFRSSEIVF